MHEGRAYPPEAGELRTWLTNPASAVNRFVWLIQTELLFFLVGPGLNDPVGDHGDEGDGQTGQEALPGVGLAQGDVNQLAEAAVIDLDCGARQIRVVS